jgi:hypothetical protein
MSMGVVRGAGDRNCIKGLPFRFEDVKAIRGRRREPPEESIIGLLGQVKKLVDAAGSIRRN